MAIIKKAKTKQWRKWRTFFYHRLVFCAKYSWLSYIYCENLEIANHKTEQYSFKVDAAKVTQWFFFVLLCIVLSFLEISKCSFFLLVNCFSLLTSYSNKEEKLVDFQFSIGLPCVQHTPYESGQSARHIVVTFPLRRVHFINELRNCFIEHIRDAMAIPRNCRCGIWWLTAKYFFNYWSRPVWVSCRKNICFFLSCIFYYSFQLGRPKKRTGRCLRNKKCFTSFIDWCCDYCNC